MLDVPPDRRSQLGRVWQRFFCITAKQVFKRVRIHGFVQCLTPAAPVSLKIWNFAAPTSWKFQPHPSFTPPRGRSSDSLCWPTARVRMVEIFMGGRTQKHCAHPLALGTLSGWAYMPTSTWLDQALWNEAMVWGPAPESLRQIGPAVNLSAQVYRDHCKFVGMSSAACRHESGDRIVKTGLPVGVTSSFLHWRHQSKAPRRPDPPS